MDTRTTTIGEFGQPDTAKADADGQVCADEVWRRFTIVDLLALAILGLLPVALLPGFFFPSNLRQTLVLVSLPAGAWLIARLAVVGRDRAAIAALAFLGVALVSAFRSESRGLAVIGATTTELSFLALTAAFGWWAIGRNLSPSAVEVLPVVLTVGAAVNVLVGVYQIIVSPTVGLYEAFGGRLSGLMSNPVFFSSTYVGLWAYWFTRAGRSESWRHLALVGAFATAIALTGSRGATGVGLLLVAVGLITHRDRSTAYAAVTSLVGVMVGGLMLTGLAPEQTTRLGTDSSSAGLSLRIEIWKVALRAWGDRPMLGWGPDPFQNRLNTMIPDHVHRDYPRLVWFDPHNVVVLVLLTTGLLGLIAIAAFVLYGLRGRVDRALLGAAVAIALSWMLQPVVLTGWPIAFAFFGAAVRPADSQAAAMSIGSRRTIAGLVALGLVVGTVYGAWSYRLREAADDRDFELFDARAGWLADDPGVALAAARGYMRADPESPSYENNLRRAEDLATAAVERSNSSESWGLLTQIYVLLDDVPAARLTAREWAAAWPHDPVAHNHVALTARADGDSEAEAAAYARVCQILGPCPPDDDTRPND